MADSRPTRPVLKPPRTTAPVKVPPGEGTSELPRGGPRIPRGLPAAPGDPKAAGEGSGGPAGGVRFVDGGATPVSHHDEPPQSAVYGKAPGGGPSEDLRPPVPNAPPRIFPPTGHGAKPA